MPRDAGHYRTRLILVRHSSVPAEGGSGAVSDVYTDDGLIWVALEEPSGADRVYWAGLQTAVDYIVRVRGTARRVRSVDRFRDKAQRVYVINGVHEDEDGCDQVCACVMLGAGNG